MHPSQHPPLFFWSVCSATVCPVCPHFWGSWRLPRMCVPRTFASAEQLLPTAGLKLATVNKQVTHTASEGKLLRASPPTLKCFVARGGLVKSFCAPQTARFARLFWKHTVSRARCTLEVTDYNCLLFFESRVRLQVLKQNGTPTGIYARRQANTNTFQTNKHLPLVLVERK